MEASPSLAPSAAAIECVALVPGPVPDGLGGGWARHLVPIAIEPADFPVACLVGPAGARIPYRHGDGRFLLPVQAPD